MPGDRDIGEAQVLSVGCPVGPGRAVRKGPRPAAAAAVLWRPAPAAGTRVSSRGRRAADSELASGPASSPGPDVRLNNIHALAAVTMNVRRSLM